jgi:hypothetical protein
MGGGYGHDIADTVQAQTNTWREALASWQAWQSGRRHQGHDAMEQSAP